MRVSGFAFPSFAKLVAINSSGQSIPSGAFTTLTGWTKQIDTANAFNAATGIYTCPSPGFYDVSTQLLMKFRRGGADNEPLRGDREKRRVRLLGRVPRTGAGRRRERSEYEHASASVPRPVREGRHASDQDAPQRGGEPRAV